MDMDLSYVVGDIVVVKGVMKSNVDFMICINFKVTNIEWLRWGEQVVYVDEKG